MAEASVDVGVSGVLPIVAYVMYSIDLDADTSVGSVARTRVMIECESVDGTGLVLLSCDVGV